MTDYKAIIYRVDKQPDGKIVLVPVTSALYLTVEQIAKTVNVSRQTVYSAIRDGKLASVRIKKVARVAVEDFMDFLARAKDEEYEPTEKAS